MFVSSFVLALYLSASASGSPDEAGLCVGVEKALDPNGDGFFEEGSNLDAMQAAEACAEAGNARGYASLAYMHRRNGDRAKATEAIGRAFAPGQDEAAGRRILCLLETDAKRDTSAIAACDRAIALRPDWAMAYNSRAFIERNAGRHDAALEYYRRALTHSPQSAAYHMGRAYTLDAQEKREAALAAAETAAKAAPAAREPYELAGRLQIDLGRFAAAEAALDKAIANAPTAVLFKNRGQARRELKNYAGALADYREAIRLDPEWADPLYGMALTYRDQNMPDQQIAALDRATQLAPDWYQPYLSRGLALERTGRLVEAIEQYKKAATIRPTSSAPWTNAASVAIRVKNYDAAQKFATEAVKREAGSATAQNNLAFAEYHLGHKQAALAAYDRSLAIDPRSQPSLFWRARTYSDLQEFDKAIADYTTLVGVNPNYGWAWVNRGQLYRLKRDYIAAWSDFDHILPGMANFSVTWLQWAEAGTITLQPYVAMRAKLDQNWNKGPASDGKYFARALIEAGNPNRSMTAIRSDLAQAVALAQDKEMATDWKDAIERFAEATGAVFQRNKQRTEEVSADEKKCDRYRDRGDPDDEIAWYLYMECKYGRDD